MCVSTAGCTQPSHGNPPRRVRFEGDHRVLQWGVRGRADQRVQGPIPKSRRSSGIPGVRGRADQRVQGPRREGRPRTGQDRRLFVSIPGEFEEMSSARRPQRGQAHRRRACTSGMPTPWLPGPRRPAPRRPLSWTTRSGAASTGPRPSSTHREGTALLGRARRGRRDRGRRAPCGKKEA